MIQEEMNHRLQEVAKLHEVAFDISASIESFARGTLAVEADLKELKDLVESTKDQEMTDAQVEDLKAKKDKLMTSAQNLFTKMYEAAAQAQQGAQGAADAGANQGAANDDVVDGDYKEV